MRYTDTITFDSHGKDVSVSLDYGVVPVRLPDICDKLLHMVVVRGFGQNPMMFLTTLAKTTTRKDLWQVVTAYFCMTWIGNSDKRAFLAKSITDASLRIHELLDFHFHAIADGIKMLLSRSGCWTGFGKEDIDDGPDLFKFFNCEE